jgi:predicted RNA-binding protein with PIN domain
MMRLAWLLAVQLALQLSLLESFAPTPIFPASLSPRDRSCLHMSKGDGKQKRKKQSPAQAATPPPATSANAPLRVSNDINIPIKRQIQWAKMNQEFIKSQTSFTQTNPKKKTSYRKQLDEEEQQQVINDRRHRNAEVDWDVILSNGNGTSAGALMLVDGYNVIYQWPRLKKQMLTGNTQRARELLVRDLEELHSIKGWRIECVFDGFGRNLNGPLGDSPGGERVSLSDREFKRQDTGRGVRIVYSGVGASADSYIEKRCLDAKSITQGKLSVSGGSLIVASNDAMIRLVATGAGALVMSSDRLVDELKAVKKVTEYRVEVAVAMLNRENRREELRKNRINLPVMQGAKGFGTRSVGLSEVDGKQVVNTFRGGQFIIEDKRKKKVKHDAGDTKPKGNVVAGDVVESTTDIPSSAALPNVTKSHDNR